MSVSEAQDGALRRVRSVGDLPCRPERAHIHSSLRASGSTSNPHDFGINEPTTIRSVPSSPPPHQNANPSVPTLPTLHTQITSPGHQDPPPQPHNTPVHVRVLTYFGLGRRATRARKSLVSLIWNVSWGFIQFVVIITMLILTGTHFRSRSDPKLSEWTACERPLGLWASIWVIRVILVSSLAYWDFRRDRLLQTPPAETEAGVTIPTAAIDPISSPNSNGVSDTSPEIPTLRHNVLHSRLTLLSSLMTLSWFLTAHILEYTSIKTCRHSSPHLWWLVFGILCIMYLMVLEVVLLGFVVLVLAPIVFIFWNIFLICIGRHPFQHPNMINPEVGKLPKTVVERIPLVIYIPPPPEGVKSALVGITHSYPPTNTHMMNRPQPRFKFLRSFRNKKNPSPQTAFDEKNDATTDKEGTWEAHWEMGEYPFVTLEGNRAACAICLMDFEEPKRKEIPGEGSSNPTGTEHGTNDVMIGGHNTSGEEDQERLKLVDAGDGVQPLRLLACSHVFHKTCLDPWLIDVSGRCPVCQRAVEIPKNSKKHQR